MKTKIKLLISTLIIIIVLIGVYIWVNISAKPAPIPEPTPKSYSLNFLLINVTRDGVSSLFVTPSDEYILPNCGIQRWGGEQLSCDSGVDFINCAEYNGTRCREKNLLICGHIISKDDILSKIVNVEFNEINLQCKDEVIDEYHLIRECYHDNELVYKCEGMSVPSII